MARHGRGFPIVRRQQIPFVIRFPAGVVSAIKTIGGIALSAVKSVNGVLISAIKSRDNISNV